MENERMEFEKSLCEMLRSLRIAIGLKQSEVASKLGISQIQYLYYETGKVCPDIYTLKKIAEVFDIEPGRFFAPEQLQGVNDAAR